MIAIKKTIALLVSTLLPLVTLADNYREHPEAILFVDEMVTNHGFERDYLIMLMTEATRRDSILEAIARPAEKTKEWKDYRNIFISNRRIQQGREFMKQYANVLARAEKQYGVPVAVITAIIGVETYYGNNKGSFRVIDALPTLAFDYPPRSEFFKKELEHYLLMVRENDFDARDLKGSYAGAMGYGQFIPSSYRSYTVDFSGDGVADIINNPVDAIGSVANYLQTHGWRRDEPIAIPCTAAAQRDEQATQRPVKPELAVRELRTAGYAPTRPVDDSLPATVMLLQGEGGEECWIGLQNFYVITRYNRSILYAMAVFELSEHLATPGSTATSSIR